jgi:hypothetical protein
VMYGITMEEFGVSKPVGVKLTAEERSEPKPRRTLTEDLPAEEIPADSPATEAQTAEPTTGEVAAPALVS